MPSRSQLKDSDIDLMVIIRHSDASPYDRAIRAHGCLREFDVPKDAIVKTQAEFDFFRADYYPTDQQDVLRTLDYIRRYGNREAFRKAGELYQWLSLSSNGPSAVS